MGPRSDPQPWTAGRDSDGVGPKYKPGNPAAQLRHDCSLAPLLPGPDPEANALLLLASRLQRQGSQQRTPPCTTSDSVHGSDHPRRLCCRGIWPPIIPTLSRARDLGNSHTVTPQAVGTWQSVSRQGQVPAPASRHLGQVRWGGGRSRTAPCRGCPDCKGQGHTWTLCPFFCPS